MTSGKRNTQKWVLEFDSDDPRFIDPLMGWSGSSDPSRQVQLRFDSRDEAVAYAEKHKIAYQVLPEHPRHRVIQAYADNFR